MIVFCCVLPASNKARDNDDDGTLHCLLIVSLLSRYFPDTFWLLDRLFAL